jgi:hypothetical protein
MSKIRKIRQRPAKWLQLSIVTPLLSKSAVARRKVRTIAEISDFFDWQLANFGELRTYQSRERLWRALLKEIEESGRAWHVLEFGVAWGHATNWWLSRTNPSVVESWDGFDRFTGLPRAWRTLPEAAFSAQGQVPPVKDPRVRWHVGDVEDTLPKLDRTLIDSGSRLFYFDLDIYEPTLAVWEWAKGSLTPGDILYFDEAYDRDERRVLDEEVLPAGEYELLGATGSQLIIQFGKASQRSLSGQ